MSTPHPISASSSAHVHPPLSKKRSSPERDEHEHPRDCKKPKSDVLSELTSPAITSASLKEKDKKKRRRKKKKLPIAATAQPHHSQPSRRSTSAPANLNPDGETGLSKVNESDGGYGMQIDVDIGEQGEASSSSDKGKARATDPIPLMGRDDKPPEEENVQSQDAASSPLTDKTVDSAEAQIVSLKEELAQKTALLNRHQSYLSSMQQSLTCEICLDFLYKPFALSPCGHVACHPCLVRWFTAPAPGAAAPPNNNNTDNNNNNNNNPNVNAEQDPVQRVLNHIRGTAGATHIQKRKTCPVCRAVVQERPVEVWGMKSMVSALVKSALVELPVPPPASGDESPSAENENNDPWHNIFRRPLPRVYNRNAMGLDYGYDMFPRWFFPEEPAPGGISEDDEDIDVAYMGVRDDSDGGIYRCPGCMHEIADGECTGCQRIFPGQGFGSDEDGEVEYGEDSEEDSDEDDGGRWFGLGGRNGAGAQRDARGHRGIQVHYRGPFDDDFVEGEVEPYPGDEVMGMPINFAFHPVHRDEQNDDDGDEDGESVSHFGHNGNHPILDWAAEEEGIGRIEEVDDEDANEEDESYEGSFIDDDGVDDPYAGPRRDVINSGRHYRSGAILNLDEEDDDVIEISEGSDEEDSQIFNTFAMLNRARQGRNNTTASRHRPGQVINSDSESENMNSDIGQRSRAGRRGRIVDTESDVDIDGDDE